MYSPKILVSLATLLLALLGISRASPVANSKCVPPEKYFYYRVPCAKYASKAKISVSRITATQGNPPVSVDKSGGLDLTQPLTLTFNMTYNGKPIRSHRLDQKLKQYVPDQNGHCHWEDIDTGGITDDIDACLSIKNVDCSYKKPMPPYVITTIDWVALWGDGISAMEPGTYYAFDIVERDGSEIINCFYMQVKVIKS